MTWRRERGLCWTAAALACGVGSIGVAAIKSAFTESERLALAGVLAGDRGLTREAYTLDLRQFTA